MDFWKRYLNNSNSVRDNDYQTNFKTNLLYFLECLATCHLIENINDQPLGNSIDKSIFDKLNWTQKIIQEDNNKV